MSFVDFLSDRGGQIVQLLFEHIQLTVISVAVAIAIGIPIGILLSIKAEVRKPVLNIINACQAVPSLAFMGFLIPIVGIGNQTAIILVVIYALLPIVKNTCTGILNLDEDVLLTAKGIGLTRSQILFKVQLPLALPIIMAGVRIAAVSSVGLVTIAAYVGGKGLGFMVYSGINMVDSYMILAGAIPAAVFALFIDFILGQVEKAVTPEALQVEKGRDSQVKNKKKHRKMLTVLISVVVVAMVSTSIYQYFENRNKIVVGSKNFTEQLLLGNIYADLIEGNTDLRVERKLNVGGTQPCYEALKKGSIDMYIDYSGTVDMTLLKNEFEVLPKDVVIERITKQMKEENNIAVLDEIGFQNAYCVAVTKEFSEKYGVTKISDLEKYKGELVFSPSIEFVNREDGLSALEAKYDLDFEDVSPLEEGLKYTALESGATDVIGAFSTDGKLKKYDLVVLEDDREALVQHWAVPLVREEVLEKYPELKEALDKLSGKLTDSQMSELNYKVDEELQKPEDVSREFLKENGLIQ